MGSHNKRQSVSAREDGTFSGRADGKMTYAFIPIATAVAGTDTTVIFMWDGINNRLYAVPKIGGTPVIVIANFQPDGIICDYRSQRLFWSNDSGGAGTYPGVSSIFMVKYAPSTGAFLETPIEIFGPSAAGIRALWADGVNFVLYFNQGNAIKRGSYTRFDGLNFIEYMGVPSSNAVNFWSPASSNPLYVADDGIGAIDKFATVVTGTPPQYIETNQFYDDGDDYDWVYGDDITNQMFISGNGIIELRVMTLSAASGVSTFHTKSNVLYEPFVLDNINGHIFISEFTSNKLYRYEYGTGSKVAQTEILDYVALSITSNWKGIILG